MRIGVIGVGNMGRHHVRVYSQMNDVSLVGIFDANIENAAKVQQAYGCDAFANVEDLLKKVDAVSIAVPTSLHYKYATRAINHKVHVLVEKPIASTLEEGRMLQELAKKNKVVLQVGHVERFNPAVQELNRILEGERVLAIEARRLSPFDGRISDADVIQDLMIHDIDVVLSLVKVGVRDIQAVAFTVKSDKNVDHCTATMMTNQNQVVCLTASRVTEQKIRELAITTESAFILMDYMDRKITISRRTTLDFLLNVEKLNYRQENLIEKVYVPAVEPLVDQLAHFVGCIREGKSPFVDGEAGCLAMAVAERIREQVYVNDCGLKVG
jgi:predicted dehydrogenase